MLSSKFKKILASTFVGASLLAGCGGGSSSTDTTSSTTGTIVDPYIVGAILCEDVNRSGTCDNGEQLSTASTATGQFTFSSPLTAGSHIIVKTQGLHNGITYDLNISGVVDSGGDIEVVSPITTLEAKGLNKAQIITLLTNAGLTGLSETDISSDPMAGVSGQTSITDAQLKKLQASLATYGLLKIIDSSNEIKAMNSSQLVSSTAVQQITTAMVTAMTNNLNQTTFTNIKTTMDGVRATANGINPLAGSYIPNVTTDVIIKTAVTVMNRIVEAGYKKCNETDGNVTLAIAEANSVAATVVSQIDTIAKYYYGLENKTKLSTIPSNFQSLIPSEIQTGVNNTAGIFVLNEENQIATKQTTKLKNLWDYVELNGGDLGDSIITAHKLASIVSSLKITNEANVTKTYTFPTNQWDCDINVSSISDGKNKLSIILSNGDENYLYFYKGSYDANDDNQSLKGDTNYYFNNIKAGGNVANDMFVMVENFNDANRSDDDRWIYMLPDNNQISVTNLKSTGGYRVTSINYEQYIVANTNANNAGQDITTTSSIDVRKFVTGQSITGTLKKLDANNTEVPFTLSDLGTESIWLHAHYAHPTATYTATCKVGSNHCSEDSSGNVWIAAQDVHLSLDEYQYQSGNYNLETGVYSINNLAQNIAYTLLAFWKEKDILGWEYNVATPTDNNIVLSGKTKDVNGTLIDYTHIRIVRKTTFSGQPYYSYSPITTKDSNNFFSINYHFDTSNTLSYLIYGNENSTLDFDSTCGINGNGQCRAITIDNNLENIVINDR
jgi:hypothetical protein